LQIVAVIVELTAKNWISFTVGRIIGYMGVGLVENAVPGYCSEISPAALRGFMSGSMTVLVTTGNTIGVGVTLPFVNEVRSIGWMVPVGIQLLPAVGIFLMVPFCPESPRWLVGKGRNDEGLKSLNRLRKQRDIDAGVTEVEIEEIKYAVEQSKVETQGRWIDLLSKKYRYRAFIVVSLFFYYETTGGQFVNVYGPTFYRQLGLGNLVFVYSTIGQGVGIVTSIIGILVIDKLGRRPPLITGVTILLVCNILIGSLGPKRNLNSTEQGVVIASIMLLLSGLKLSFQLCGFLLTSEIGGARMRKKFMGMGTTADVIFRFVFILIVPYFLNDPLYMGARFAFVMAFIALCSFVFVVLCVPETKGKALEEMDELFAMKLWPWQWTKAQTTIHAQYVADAEARREGRQLERESEKEKEIAAVEHREMA